MSVPHSNKLEFCTSQMPSRRTVIYVKCVRYVIPRHRKNRLMGKCQFYIFLSTTVVPATKWKAAPTHSGFVRIGSEYFG